MDPVFVLYYGMTFSCNCRGYSLRDDRPLFYNGSVVASMVLASTKANPAVTKLLRVALQRRI